MDELDDIVVPFYLYRLKRPPFCFLGSSFAKFSSLISLLNMAIAGDVCVVDCGVLLYSNNTCWSCFSISCFDFLPSPSLFFNKFFSVFTELSVCPFVAGCPGLDLE